MAKPGYPKCNRKVCSNEAFWWNRSTLEYYCTPCARRINENVDGHLGIGPPCVKHHPCDTCGELNFSAEFCRYCHEDVCNDDDAMHYSGDNSNEFWSRINTLPESAQSKLYAMGCELQNLEYKILKELQKAESAKA